MLLFDMELGAGEQKELNFVLAIAENGRAAFELYDGLQAGFATLKKKTSQFLPAWYAMRLPQEIQHSAEVCRGWLQMTNRCGSSTITGLPICCSLAGSLRIRPTAQRI